MRSGIRFLIIGLVIFCASAQAYDWSTNPGSGTSENPYQISYPNHLIAIGSDPNLLDKYFILTNDIIFDPNSNSEHVFSSALIAPDNNNDNSSFEGTEFTGKFDGAGYSILNLNIDASTAINDYIGLFGQIGKDGEIVNLRMNDCCTKGADGSFYYTIRIGLLAGANLGTIVNCYSDGIVTTAGTCMGGIVGFNAGSIQDSTFTGKVEYESASHCGGVAGLNEGQILNCFSNCFVGGYAGYRGGNGIGGVVGFNQGSIRGSHAVGNVQGNRSVGGLSGGNPGIIINCYSECNVTGTRSIGGLVGQNNAEIQDCYSTGSVEGGDGSGGFVGGNGGEIRRCFATGDVSGNADATGGFAGGNGGEIFDCYSRGNVQGKYYTGGFAGGTSGLIANCYSTGMVQSSTSTITIGGFVSSNLSGAVYLCYWDSENSGLSESAAGMAKTTLEMKQKVTFKGWSDGTWRIDNGNGYPRLSWENTDGEIIFEPERTYGGGSGTIEDPYQIRSCEHFQTLGFYRDDLNKHFILMNDLVFDPNIQTLLNPIGTLGLGFTGTFNGRGHVISNAAYHGEYCKPYSGIFGYIENNASTRAAVKNLIITNSTINIRGELFYSGLLAGFVKEGLIENCHVKNGEIRVDDTSLYSGGLVGYNWGKISDCSVEGRIIANEPAGILIGRNCGIVNMCKATGNISGNNYIGGLIGHNYGGTVMRSEANVTVTGNQYVGGLVGHSNSVIEKSKANAIINAQFRSQMIGGLVGYNSQGSVTDCYAVGHVNSGESSSAVGGLVGFNNGDLIECYAATAIDVGDNSGDIGALAGKLYAVEFDKCYFLAGTGPDNGYGTPLTDEQMQIKTNFENWDFVGGSTSGDNAIWRMCVDGVSYPRLFWEFAREGDFACADGVGLEDIRSLSECWLALIDLPTELDDDDNLTVDLSEIERIGEYWLQTNCDLCGGIDINDDHAINIKDFKGIAKDWLKTVMPECSACDANGDEVIDMADFSVLSESW